MIFHILDVDRLTHGEAVSENPVLNGDARESDMTLKRAWVTFSFFADFHRDADERRAVLGDIGRTQETIVRIDEINGATLGGDDLADAIDDDAGKHGGRWLVLDGEAKVMQEGEHPMFFIFELVEFPPDAFHPAALVAQRDQQDHGDEDTGSD